MTLYSCSLCLANYSKHSLDSGILSYYAHNNLSEQVARYVKKYVHHCREERYNVEIERYEANVKKIEQKMEAADRKLPW